MNVMELFGQFEEAKSGLEKISKDFNPEILLKGSIAHVCKFTLETMLKAGPPADLAAKLSVNDEHAAILYRTVLTSAIKRTETF